MQGFVVGLAKHSFQFLVLLQPTYYRSITASMGPRNQSDTPGSEYPSYGGWSKTPVVDSRYGPCVTDPYDARVKSLENRSVKKYFAQRAEAEVAGASAAGSSAFKRDEALEVGDFLHMWASPLLVTAFYTSTWC